MAFYVQQSIKDFDFKMGFAEERRLEARHKDHETRGCSQLRIGFVPGADKKQEQAYFERLNRWRIQGKGRRAFEVFLPVKEVFQFINSRTLLADGFVRENSPMMPERETHRSWLERVAMFRNGDVRAAALHNLEMDTQLTRRIRFKHRGGWTLAGALAGDCAFCSKQLILNGVEARLVDQGKYLMQRIWAKGTSWDFFVFAEGMARSGKPPHPKAVVGGIPMRAKIAGGFGGPVVRKATVAFADPNQLTVFR